MSSNPYETLGVTPSAKQDEIRDAYRKLAKKLHPDLNPGNKEAEKRFKEVNAAYELVGTPEQRTKFDRGETREGPFASGESGQGPRGGRGPFYGQSQQAGGRYSFGGSDFDEDFLSSIFGRVGRGEPQRERDRSGQDVLYELPIELVDAALGAEKDITLTHGKRLRVKIPPGVESGVKLRFGGQGEPGVGSGAAGDAYVQLNVKPHPWFRRNGADLELDVPISVSEAILGGEVRVPTLDGTVLLKVPAQVSSGSRLKIAGKGAVQGSSGKRGDQFVVLKITLPRPSESPDFVDPEFKEATEKWAKRHPFDARTGWPHERSGS